MSTTMSTSPSFVFSSEIFITLEKCVEAVFRNASSGQARNQSIVVQFTSAGNVRKRRRKASPTGEKASTKCRFLLQVSKNTLMIMGEG